MTVPALTDAMQDDGDMDDNGYCWRCDGEGFVLVCCDDTCHGLGYCIHGDGEAECPECGGDCDE